MAATDPPPRPRRSALIVTVPRAEALVGRWRAELDATAGQGVPAHVTVLFPFAPAADLDRRVLAGLTGLLAAVAPFEARLERTAWFDDRVLYLAPQDPAPFVALTGAVAAAHPQYPPYEGVHGDDVVPHLTIGADAPLDRLRAAERDVAGGLPLAFTVEAVEVFVESGDGRWASSAVLPLTG